MLTAYLCLPSQSLGLHLCRLHSSAPLPQQPDRMHQSRLVRMFFFFFVFVAVARDSRQVQAGRSGGGFQSRVPGLSATMGDSPSLRDQVGSCAEALVAYIKSWSTREVLGRGFGRLREARSLGSGSAIGTAQAPSDCFRPEDRRCRQAKPSAEPLEALSQ